MSENFNLNDLARAQDLMDSHYKQRLTDLEREVAALKKLVVKPKPDEKQGYPFTFYRGTEC